MPKTPPEGASTLSPYITVNGAAEAIEFYKKAFDASESFRMEGPGGKIFHAEIKVNGAGIMLADEFPGMNKSPQTLSGTPVMMHLYVADVDATFKKALAAGAKEIQPVKDQFYGDRGGGIVDPFGHKWWIATHIEDVSADELKKRGAEHMKKMAEQQKKSAA